MIATIDAPVIVETRPADEPVRPAKTEQPEPTEPTTRTKLDLDPWERPEWQAHRRKVLAMPLYGDIKAFVVSCEGVIKEADRLADELYECPDGESPFSAGPGCSERSDYTTEFELELRAIARVLNAMMGLFNGEL